MRLNDTINYKYSFSLKSNNIIEIKIIKTIKKFNSYKTSNFTNISNRVIQLLIFIIFFELHMLFNACYNINYCSKTFKNSITMTLKKFKNNDFEKFRNYSKSKLYRSIALLKILNKIFEIIMTSKII